MQLAYELYNYATGEVEAVQPMTVAAACRRNRSLAEERDERRWLWQGRDVMEDI